MYILYILKINNLSSAPSLEDQNCLDFSKWGRSVTKGAATSSFSDFHCFQQPVTLFLLLCILSLSAFEEKQAWPSLRLLLGLWSVDHVQ